MYKIKLIMSVTHIYIYIYIYFCCEMNVFFFFSVFINNFSKIHRNVLRKITKDLLYFWDIHDINLWEKNSAEVQLIHAKQMLLYNFIISRKKRDSKTSVFLWNLWNFQKQWWLLLKTSNTLCNEKSCSA